MFRATEKIDNIWNNVNFHFFYDCNIITNLCVTDPLTFLPIDFINMIDRNYSEEITSVRLHFRAQSRFR